MNPRRPHLTGKTQLLTLLDSGGATSSNCGQFGVPTVCVAGFPRPAKRLDDKQCEANILHSVYGVAGIHENTV